MLGHLHAAFNSIYDKAFQISLLKAALYIYTHMYVYSGEASERLDVDLM